nr:SGNH/GDSL hydrolase family protein [Aestuariicella hydrocarbonica]
MQAGADIAPARPYRDDLPLVFYGSSIVQGAGVNLSCMSYPAIIARELNSDFINWGFYGAGRGEPEVIDLVAGCPAKAFILDLGKSYGIQPADVYLRMLKQLRQAQPAVPLVVITPVFSSRECFDSGFRTRTQRTRQIMREAVEALEGVLLVEGETLLGERDWPGLSPDGLHPNEKGCAETAKRLLPVIQAFYC